MNADYFIKFLSNEADEKEKLTFYKKLKKDKKLESEFLSAKKIWATAQLGDINIPVARKEQLFKEFWRKREKKNKNINSNFSKISRYAAIFVLLISLPFVFYLGSKKGNPKQTFTTISCALGDKTEIVLPDSTKVNLNSGSTLVFNNNFDEGVRKVQLQGEAFFKVSKNKKSPFTVVAGDVEVEVLGTEFNLKGYPEENIVSTTLVEGSLKVSSKSQSVVIEPNQKLMYNKESKLMKRQLLTDTTPETEWKEGRLVFRNESLADLEMKLERWFDVDIDFADEEVKTKRFTGILERESILEATSYFGYSNFVDYTIDGNEITFYSKN